jgi:Family of unknown function (DUF6524)
MRRKLLNASVELYELRPDSNMPKIWSASLLSWISLIATGIVLGTGLSWSLLRTRVTGQVEVD